MVATQVCLEFSPRSLTKRCKENRILFFLNGFFFNHQPVRPSLILSNYPPTQQQWINKGENSNLHGLHSYWGVYPTYSLKKAQTIHGTGIFTDP